MKQIYILLVAMCSMIFTAYSKSDDKKLLNADEEEGVITMVVDANKWNDEEYQECWVCSFKEGEIITVDWGDGSVEEFKTVAEYDEGIFRGYWSDYLEHSYAKKQSYTIIIKGNIKDFSCGNSCLTSLDVSKCPALVELYCEFNNLTSLDVSKNTVLLKLHCYDTNLTSLDISKNTALIQLRCDKNNLTSLDISKNIALIQLWCEENNLTSLDVSKNTALLRLWCDKNNLTSLELGKNTVLRNLNCRGNKLSASALNKIFTDLPQGTPWIDWNGNSRSDVIILTYDNPGALTCDKSIAEKKGWRVN